jgi:KDO2-lipid IV(A) lauroyltransferase
MAYIEYYVVKLFLFVFQWLPQGLVYGFTKGVALIFYFLLKRRRIITIENLQSAFPLKNTQEVHELARETYVSLSRTIAEIFLMISGHFEIDPVITNKKEILETLSALKEKYPKGWIFVTAHFSNWEVLAKFLAKHGYPMLVIGREGDNRLIDHHITVPFREEYGNTTAYKKKAAVSIFKTLKRGENVGILIDQKVHESEAVKVKFFGRDAYTSPLVATMKKKLDIAVIPVFLPRLSDGSYKVELSDATSFDDSIEEMTQHYNDIMEKIVRHYPSQWFWMHNRWKKNVNN